MKQEYKDDPYSVVKDWLSELMPSKAITLFEPETVSLPSVRAGQSRFILGRLIKSNDDSFILFPQCYGRNTTIAGIWMFIEKNHRRECLVTAFGKRIGAGARFYGVHISHGARHNVNFSPACIDYFQKHIAEISNAEILVCHNHPRNSITGLLSQIIDWSPVPSNMDRETAYRFKYRAIVNWLATGNFHNIRFFLVEDGRLGEILLPSAERVVKFIRMALNL